ncbi:MAG: hypothetical protein NTX45_26705, partial [Proteobacteria bacterium]|nr:hypothetical protein [Pseudomonadota bacterium]
PTDTGPDDFFFEAVSFEVDHAGNSGGVCRAVWFTEIAPPLLTQRNRFMVGYYGRADTGT